MRNKIVSLRLYSVQVLILIIAMTAVFSGCSNFRFKNLDLRFKSEEKKTEINNQEQARDNQDVATTTGENIPREEIKYLENGEIDTSDWKTYRNEHYKLEMKYPPFMGTYGQNSKDFGISYGNDIKYNYYFHRYVVRDLYDEIIELEAKRNYIIEGRQDSPIFEELAIKNGYAFFIISDTLGGYSPTVVFISKTVSLSGSVEIYSDEPEFKDQDQKYIDIFKAIAKTIKFNE